MCGVAGYLGSLKVPDERVENCLSLMQHRGPDAKGVYRYKYESGQNVCLLHSRLAIIDLDKRSNQPFRIGSKVLVDNGELYNYIELKNELAAKGQSFETKSDTEVLLRFIDMYGWQGLDRCEGMWAFALYDENDGSLTLSRDRFGEKPLYLYEDKTGLYFGSEVKLLHALSGKKFTINYRHIYRYLVNGYKSLYKVDETFFNGVHEFPPSSVLILFPDGSRVQEKFWAPLYAVDPSMTYEDAVAGARDALIRSVRLRLRADVPLAFCMSGGVDSNSLISIAKNVCNYDVHGFTIVNTDERYEEQDLVDCAVSKLGIRHTSVPLNRDGFLENLRHLIQYHDAPVYTISYYAHWLLMNRIAREGYRISISGTGADEFFTGYYDHHGMYLYEVRNNPSLFRTSLQNWVKHIKPIVRNPVLQDPQVFVKNPDERRHIYLDADYFANYLKGEFKETFNEARYSDELLRNRMLNELFSESVPVILHEDDLNAMYHSIENRSPFLDRELFEFCYSVPADYLIGEGYNKKVLRDAMKGIVPEEILNSRRKVGFNAPIHSLLNARNQRVKAELLDESPIFDHVYKSRIEEILEKEYLPNSESKFLFYFLCSKIFLEEFS